MPDPRRQLHSQLKDVTRRYGHALERYDQAMNRGDIDRADQAITDMQEIENSVTLIIAPVRK